jgi:hypothetical protein
MKTFIKKWGEEIAPPAPVIIHFQKPKNEQATF